MKGEGIPHIVFFFLDGVGIGKKDPHSNPLFTARLPVLKSLLDGTLPSLSDPAVSSRRATVVPLDAVLGVDGLPQSGTGQTTLLTGVNAARFIGKHFGPYPYSTLRPLLNERNFFALLSAAGRDVCYVNPFPQRYIDYTDKYPARMTAIPSAWRSTGKMFLNAADLLHGMAVSPDITNARWKDLGHPEIPVLTPYNAGERLAEIAALHHLTFFEYYATDKAGHRQSMEDAIAVLEQVDEFLSGILDHFRDETMLLMITSDHGNLEDLTVKTHTRNPVPFLLAGRNHNKISLHALDDVPRFIYQQLIE